MSNQERMAKGAPNWSYAYSSPRKWWVKNTGALMIPTTVVIALGLTWVLLREGAVKSHSEISLLVNNSPMISTAPTVLAASPKKHTRAEVRVEPPASTQPQSVLTRNPTRETVDNRNSAHAAGLLYRLARMEFTNGALTVRQAETIRQILKELIALGPTAVPAIRNFLLRFENIAFEDLVSGGLLEHRTLRLALLDALEKIGGSEAEHVLRDQLQITGEPYEIAALAETLERLAPGKYDEPILNAARETLALISQGSSDRKGVDTAPLFRVFQKYGDETTAAELEKVPRWFKQYATVALANFPGGEGIPRLIQMSHNPAALRSEGGRLALQMLAQVAVDHPEAEAALFDAVLSGNIPASFWPRLADVLAGDSQVQIQKPDERTLAQLGSVSRRNPYSTHTVVDRQTQVLYSVHTSAALTAQDIEHRLDLINRLMDETANPVALKALDRARVSLQRTADQLK